MTTELERSDMTISTAQELERWADCYNLWRWLHGRSYDGIEASNWLTYLRGQQAALYVSSILHGRP